MGTSATRLVSVCCLAVLLLLPAAMLHAEPNRTGSARQLQLQKRLERLESVMRALRDKYEAMPEEDRKRRILAGALEKMESELVIAKAEDIHNSIRRGDAESAIERGEELVRSLKEIGYLFSRDQRSGDLDGRREAVRDAREGIESLTERERRIRAEAEEIRRGAVPASIRQATDSLGKLRRDQERLAEQTARAVGGDSADRSDAVRVLEELIRRHRKITEADKSSGEGEDTRRGRVAEQRQLAGDTGRAADAMEKVAGESGSDREAGRWQEASARTDAASEAMQQAAEERARGNRKEAAEAEARAAGALKDAMEALDGEGRQQQNDALAGKQEELAAEAGDVARMIRQAAESEELGESGEQQAENAGSRTEQSSQQMKKTSAEMKQNMSRAPGMQQQAVEYLRSAEEEMKKLERSLLSEDDRMKIERLAARQRELEREARSLAEKLKIEEELFDREAGDSAGEAADQMLVVSGEFNQEFLDSGIWEAEEAIRYLEEAARRLRRQENRYATEQFELILSRIQGEVARLLEGQQKLMKDTTEAAGEAADEVWGATLREELATRQDELAAGAGGLVGELVAAGSDAYVWLVKETAGSMKDAASEIRGGEFDPGAVSSQQDAIESLELMLDGLKKLLGRLDEERDQQNSRNMAMMQDQKSPAVTPLDELRLILAVEKQTRGQMKALIRRVESGKRVSSRMLNRLKDRRTRGRKLMELWEAKFMQRETGGE